MWNKIDGTSDQKSNYLYMHALVCVRTVWISHTSPEQSVTTTDGYILNLSLQHTDAPVHMQTRAQTKHRTTGNKIQLNTVVLEERAQNPLYNTHTHTRTSPPL